MWITGTNSKNDKHSLFRLYKVIIIAIITIISKLNRGYIMIKQEPVMALRKNLGEILNGVEYKHDTVIITRAGKASAAIIDINLFEKIRHMKNRFEVLTSELQKSFSNVTEQEQEILINKALMEVRNK